MPKHKQNKMFLPADKAQKCRDLWHCNRSRFGRLNGGGFATKAILAQVKTEKSEEKLCSQAKCSGYAKSTEYCLQKAFYTKSPLPVISKETHKA